MTDIEFYTKLAEYVAEYIGVELHHVITQPKGYYEAMFKMAATGLFCGVHVHPSRGKGSIMRDLIQAADKLTRP